MQGHARKDHTSVRPFGAIQRPPSREIPAGPIEASGDAGCPRAAEPAALSQAAEQQG